MLIKKKVLVGFISGFMLLLPAGAASARSVSTDLLQAMNAVRTGNHLAPLRIDSRLARTARAHSADMLRHNYFSHGNFSARVRASGARGPTYGENLAWGTAATAQWVIGKWLASPAHRAILLRSGFRRVGIGTLSGTFGGATGATVVTADFAGS